MATGDDSRNLEKFWKGKLDSVIRGDADPLIPTGTASALQESRSAVLMEPMVTVPETERLTGSGVPDAIVSQRKEVKGRFARRKELERPAEPGAKGSVKHASGFDNSKLLKMEAEMAKRFADKVAMPAKSIRASRFSEQQAAQVADFCRGNELFEKRDYEAAASEYAHASEVPQLKLFAMLNRGNAYKSLEMYAEAMACYQDVIDAAPLHTSEGRLIHSCALNNLGAACQDDLRNEQALQHFSSAIALNPKCNLAIKNRANLHLAHAEDLQHSADVPALVPPQHELAHSLYHKSMMHDWHLPVVFSVDNGVLVRLDSCITSSQEEPAMRLTRNVTCTWCNRKGGSIILVHVSSLCVRSACGRSLHNEPNTRDVSACLTNVANAWFCS